MIQLVDCGSAGPSCFFSIMTLPFNSEKKKICSSSVYGEANIRVGKEFLMKLSFHSDNVQEEYL